MSRFLLSVACLLIASQIAFSAPQYTAVTYYADTIGGGPPGLYANPVIAPVGQCIEILSDGFSILIDSCVPGGNVSSTVYPDGPGPGCSGAPGPVYSLPAQLAATTMHLQRRISVCQVLVSA